jgi:hypothetical protein
MKSILLSLVLLVSFISCDTARPRKANGCIFSRYYGGPYRVISSEGEHLELLKLKTREIKELPKDNSWQRYPCYN